MKEDYATEDRAMVAAKASKLPLNEQDKIISELNEVINNLTDRLVTVLTPEPENTMKDPGDSVPEPPKSELQIRLNEHNYQISRAIRKVNALLDRLEV